MGPAGCHFEGRIGVHGVHRRFLRLCAPWKPASSRRGKTQSGAERKAAPLGRSRMQSSVKRRSPSRNQAQAGRKGQTASSGRGRTQPGSKGQTTRDHDIIRHWAEQRGGKPSMVEGTQILRINFDEPGGDDDNKLKEVSWEGFFQVFDDSDLDFLYSEQNAEGQTSRFFKFVRKE
jgi:hypothetical protein